MKKHLLIGMAAIASLFATSCSEELEQVNAGKSSTVSFKVETPEIKSRAYSDGKTATVLQYAVYNAAGEVLTQLTVNNGEIHGSTTVPLTLTTGNTYSVIFWAAAPNVPYTVDFGDKLENAKMTVDYTKQVSNDENRDAFYACHTFTVKGAQTETVDLKRPFAQLNIGTADFVESKNAGYVPQYSSVKVSNVYTTLDFYTGSVSGEAKDVLFESNVIPTIYNETEKKFVGEKFPVEGNYNYLAMNYLLVPDTDNEVIEVEFTYGLQEDLSTDAANSKKRIVGSVPVRRNHRTNIYGNLLTSDVKVNVEIKPGYDDPALESHPLYHAAAFGGVVTLTEDVTLNAPLAIQANATINLGGYTLTGVVVVEEGVQATINNGKIVNTDNSVSGITSNGDLTLNNVEVESARHALRIENGTAVINGGTYCLEPNSAKTLHALNVSGKSNVIVKGGTFVGPKGTEADSGSAVNVQIGATVTIEGGDFSGGKTKTLQSKGTLNVVGGAFDQDPKNYVVSGYKAINKDGKYYVVADDVTVVSNTDNVEETLSSGGKIILVSDVTLNKIDLTKNTQDVVIDGNGYTIKTASNYGVEANAGKNITLKNAKIEITVEGNYINYAAGFKIANGDYENKTIELENCEIKMANADWAYAINMPASVKNLNLVIDNCTLEGAIALQCWGDNNIITVTNSNLICNYTTSKSYTSYCVALQGDGTYMAENNILKISDCSFSYTGVDNFNSEIGSVVDTSGATNTISVSNCTYDKVVAYE